MTHPSRATIPSITEVEEYAGEAEVRIRATQLGTDYTASRAKRVVDAWCAFFASGPSDITSLAFTARTPRRLFDSLGTQTQLRSLAVKWGDYDDLTPLVGMTSLRELWLGGASSVRTLDPLARLPQLERLAVESLRHAHDLSPLGSLVNLRDLELGGDWMAPRTAHVDSLGFVVHLGSLERLVLHTVKVDDLDYSPLLALGQLREARVMVVRGMRPAHAELCEAIPALAPAP